MRTNCWWRLSGYVMRHRRDLLLGFGAALAGTVIAVLVPLVTKRVIDDAIAADHRPLAPWAVVLVAAAGATYLLTYVRRYYGGRIAHLVQHDLRMDAFQALLRWDGRQQDRWSSGQLIVRTTNDLQLVQALLFDVPNVLRHVLTLLLGVAVMTWLSVPLALLAVLLVPVIGLIAHRSRRLLAAATHCAQEHKAAVTGVVDAAVCGIRVVKAFGQEERETVKLVTASRALYAAQLRVARLNAHFGPLLQTLPALGQMAVFALGGWMAAQGSITVGTFVAFWACLTLLARPACDLAGMLTIAQQARAGAVRVLELIDSRPTLVDGTKPLSPEARLSLEFQRVSFGYVADRPVLREISLSVRAGETLAVVGAPGSGKSTLASLATRCYDVTQGAVRIGGQDVRELTLDSLRSAIGLVPEDAVLFSGTIGANIAYGRPDATPEQIATAARAAHIEEFVNTLPDGYQTAVGARGLTLSGGQRQRIALARALLHQPRLLIMDDPTSAVDAVIECGIQEVLREAIADRTAVIFTRRRSMLTLADRVAVLDSGRLLDVGTPDEVWERCPRYRELLSPAPDLADDLVVAERSPVCRPVAGLGTKAAQHTNVHNPGPHDHPPGPDPLRRLLREFRGPLALSLLLVAVQTCAGLLPPLLIRHGIDVGIRRHVLSALWWAALAGTATVVIRWVVQWGSAMVAGYTGEQVLFRLRSVVFAHAQRLGLDAFEDDGDAQIVTAVSPAARPVGTLRGEVVFDAVHYSYRTREVPALAGINLRIPAGQTVVFVGSTGSGKSTLIKLVARFYDPTHGTVRVDGCDLREFDVDGYRNRLGIVTQEQYVFAGTVRDAIAYGRPDATDAQVERAAREVGAHPMITALDNGYLHQVTAGGRNLSAGQLQLLALARARLVDLDILLLDEATVALDPATEAVVQRATLTLAARRTTLIVAHGLAIAEHADRIVVLEHGTVVEDGAHTELLAAGGHYSRLWAAHTRLCSPEITQLQCIDA